MKEECTSSNRSFTFLLPHSYTSLFASRLCPAMTNPSRTSSLSNENARRIILLPDRVHLVAVTNDRTIKVLSIHTRTALKEFKCSLHGIHDVAKVNDAHALVIGVDGTLGKWNILNRRLLELVEFRRFPGSSTNIGHRRLVSIRSSGGRWEYQWDGAGSTRRTFPLGPQHIQDSQIAAWGDNFAISFGNLTPIQVWSVLTMRCVGRIDVGNDLVSCVSLNNYFVVTGSRQGSISIYSVRYLRLLCRIRSNRGKITGVHLTSNNDLISSSCNGTVTIHELYGGAPVWYHHLPKRVWSVAVLPGRNSRIICGMDNGQVWLVSPPQYVVQRLRVN